MRISSGRAGHANLITLSLTHAQQTINGGAFHEASKHNVLAVQFFVARQKRQLIFLPRREEDTVGRHVGRQKSQLTGQIGHRRWCYNTDRRLNHWWMVGPRSQAVPRTETERWGRPHGQTDAKPRDKIQQMISASPKANTNEQCWTYESLSEDFSKS